MITGAFCEKDSVQRSPRGQKAAVLTVAPGEALSEMEAAE